MLCLLSALLSGGGTQGGRRGISIHPLCHQADQASFIATPVLPAQQPSGTRGAVSGGLQLGHSEEAVLEAAVWTSALPTWPFFTSITVPERREVFLLTAEQGWQCIPAVGWT